MGERTQLFINIEDINGEQILGTVIHYQWGFGKVMLESALHIIANLSQKRSDYSDKAGQDNAQLEQIYNFMKVGGCGSSRPDLSYRLRCSIRENVKPSGCLNIDTEDVEQKIGKANAKIIDFQHKAFSEGINAIDPVNELKNAFAAKYSNFFKQCANNDGLMIINIKSKDTIDKENVNFLKQAEVKVGFGMPNFLSYEKSDWYPITFERYATQSCNRSCISKGFIRNYKKLLRAYGVEMMLPNELNLRKRSNNNER